MRVLLVGDAGSPHLRRWANALVETCTVLLAGFGSLDEPAVEFVPLGPANPSPRHYLQAIPELARLARKMKPDIAHAHYVSSYGVLATQARPPCPVVLSTWGTDILWMSRRPRWLQWLTRKALSSASLVTYESTEIRQRLDSLVGPPRLRRLLFGPERSWCEQPRNDKPWLLSPRTPRLLYRVPTIVDAFVKIANDHQGWHLNLTTWGWPKEMLQGAGLGPNYHSRICLLPLLERVEFQQQMLQCAAFCSVPETDSTSATLLEGMASGSLPLVSDLPANREWVDHGVNGLVVPVGNVRALAAAMERAILDVDLRTSSTKLNRDRIAREASWETAVTAVLSAYTALSKR